jgi:ribosomal protein S12 methylthiotransferase accessory factor
MPRPLEIVRNQLQRHLDPRYVQFPSLSPEDGAEPLVVPLGALDPLGDGCADPYAAVRARATVHLTGRTVLIGPGRGGGAPGEEGAGDARPACGTCLGLYWQRLRRGPARRAREWGHEPHGGAENPVLGTAAVDVVRTVWSAVFGPAGQRERVGGGSSAHAGTGCADRTPAGLVRVTCVDLRTPVPRTHTILPPPDCGPHTGTRG